MSLRREPPAPSETSSSQDPIAAFWAWWTARGGELAAQLPRIDPKLFGAEINPLLERMSPTGLAWEVGPGCEAENVLTVSGEGNAEKRRVTQRWFDAAPPTDRRWEYSP